MVMKAVIIEAVPHLWRFQVVSQEVNRFSALWDLSLKHALG